MSKGPEQRVLSHLGLCVRAGQLVTGEELVLEVVRNGKAKLVILTTDASDNTAKRIQDKCAHYEIPMVVAFTRGQLGDAIGKAERVVVAVTDKGFGKLIGDGLKTMEVDGNA